MNYREKLSNYFLQRNRGWILSLFAAVCLVYLPFIGNPFVFDDVPFFSGDIAGHYTHSLFQFELRWLPYASLGWTTAIFSDALPHPFHLGNLLLHAANVVLLFFLLRKLASAAIHDGEKSSAAIWGAWFGALIFACHPVAVYAVGYVIQRSILMATLFSLIAQLAYLRGLLSGQNRWLLLAVGAYLLACYSKEHSVMVPALLAAQTILVRTKIKTVKGVLWSTWIAFTAIAVFMVVLVLHLNGAQGVTYEPFAANSLEQHGLVESTSTLHGLSALSQAGLFFKYLLLWLIPDPAWMSIDMRVHFVASWLDWQGWLGGLGFISYGVLGGWLLLRPGWIGFAGLALLYPWLQFMVEFPAIRVQEPFALYRSYLWMPGMMLFFPLLLAKPLTAASVEVLPSIKTKTLLGMGFIAVLLISLAWNRLWVFGDEYRLWNDAALLLNNEKETGADRIFYNRGRAELGAQKWEDAIADLQRSVTLSPEHAPIHYELGAAYISSGRYQDALAQFDAAIKLKADDASYYYAKGLALKRLHQDDLAMRQMEKSCELKNVMACTIVQTRSSQK